jgi:hypothetical protein
MAAPHQLKLVAKAGRLKPTRQDRPTPLPARSPPGAPPRAAIWRSTPSTSALGGRAAAGRACTCSWPPGTRRTASPASSSSRIPAHCRSKMAGCTRCLPPQMLQDRLHRLALPPRPLPTCPRSSSGGAMGCSTSWSATLQSSAKPASSPSSPPSPAAHSEAERPAGIDSRPPDHKRLRHARQRQSSPMLLRSLRDVWQELGLSCSKLNKSPGRAGGQTSAHLAGERERESVAKLCWKRPCCT